MTFNFLSFEDDFEEIDLTGKRNLTDVSSVPMNIAPICIVSLHLKFQTILLIFQVDDFEEMCVADDWTPLDDAVNSSSAGDKTIKELNVKMNAVNMKCGSVSSLPTNTNTANTLSSSTMPSTDNIPPAGPTLSSQTVTASCTLLRTDDECNSSNTEKSVKRSKAWTRYSLVAM